jgi:hypothetical protein
LCLAQYYSLSNPLKYTDPDGHNPIIFGLLMLGAAYVTGRYGIFEGAAIGVPAVYNATRDVIGGALVTDASEAITAQSAQQSVDATLIGAVLRHESAGGDRRAWTFLPLSQPGAAADLYETIEANIRTGGALGYASIGPAQMQLRRAQMLEDRGYVTARGSNAERIQALLGRDTSVEYAAGMLHYISDQFQTYQGFSDLSRENQQRLILIGYNWGWTPEFLDQLTKRGLLGAIEYFAYDNQTLDEYLRWIADQ